MVMATMAHPLYHGDHDPTEWLADFEWFMFTVGQHNDRAKLMGILMVLQEVSLVWVE